MKQCQNNFTTPEQSKRLLELGLSANSADCYFHYFKGNLEYKIRQTEWELSPEFFTIPGNAPCWSVGKLIEIWMKLHNAYKYEYYGSINSIIEDFQYMKENCDYDFSKLEE